MHSNQMFYFIIQILSFNIVLFLYIYTYLYWYKKLSLHFYIIPVPYILFIYVELMRNKIHKTNQQSLIYIFLNLNANHLLVKNIANFSEIKIPNCEIITPVLQIHSLLS